MPCRALIAAFLIPAVPGFAAPSAAPLVPSTAAPLQDLSQADAQKAAEQAHQLGADQSLRTSATGAMKALIQFGDGEIKNALTTAYKAYGSFKNSENLDRAHKQGILARASLGSADSSNINEKDMAFLTSSTSYRRLDPSFLTRGEDAKVAEEFEKKTGIQRKDFLDMLSGLAENKLYVSDPKLAEKVDAQVEGFLAKIPNDSFREKAANALSLVPSLSRHKLVVEAVQNMVKVAQGFTAGAAPAPLPAAAKAPPPKDDKAPLAEAARGPAAGADAGEAKAAGDEAVPDITGALNSDAMARADDGGLGHKLDGVIRAAIHDDPEKETIFEKVSRRYRMLTPDLGPPKATGMKD